MKRQLYLLDGATGTPGSITITLPAQDTPFRLRTVTCTYDTSGGFGTWYAITLRALEGKIASTMRLATPDIGPSLTGGVTFGVGLTLSTARPSVGDILVPLPDQVFQPNTEISLQMFTDNILSTADLIGVPVFIIERL